MSQPEVKLVSRFDRDGNQRLDAAERKEARAWLAAEKAAGRGPRQFGPPGGRRRPESDLPAPAPGPRLAPGDVTNHPEAALYDPFTLRTFFLEFENADWEKELTEFYHTDVEVPARLTVDGKVYPEVGVHFRGASSFFTVGSGRKHSLNLSLDFVREDQRLGGYRTLNLLNSHTDPTYLRSLLYYEVAREYLPAPRANHVRVVINGESWGIYVNVQQFNKDFTKEFFQSTGGARWKVPGSPRAQGGLTYLGEKADDYRRHYEIKSKDTPESWSALIRLCRVLSETPSNQLEAALAPMLDIDGVLRFLALENVFINSDGYWVRSSDYALYWDEKGRFHLVPLDANETFRAPEGPGMGRRGGPGGRGGGGPRVDGVKLDPLVAATDVNKPLLSKLLAVPALRAKYLGYVRGMTERWLDWDRLGPIARKHQELISADVKTDTHRLDSHEAFQRGLDGVVEPELDPFGPPGARTPMSLKQFVEERRAYLLSLPSVRTAALPAAR